ncbi:hypothetical protein [Verrucosispora sp. WMMD1129]|uniref:hypothetical protein n=1 Tax=Verrucosispora sp. WMMD1129 TaxID=3016093 RepID=UPI00249BD51C|nr:hypothetical protein [Verrucosispora sp. WMMD1129]WFE47642.1 hypothetical protein O7624_26615 [Verrucosispora sp. WMMD1129]
MSDVDDELDHQGMAIELIDAFIEHDPAGVAGLDAARPAAQLRARRAVYNRARVSTGSTRRLTTSPPAHQEFMRVLNTRRATNGAVPAGACSRRDGDR